MRIANKNQEVIHTQYQWAALGFVVKKGCPGEEMWTNGMMENKAVYFREDEVERNARKANAYIHQKAKERAKKDKEFLLQREAERKARQTPYVCVMTLDDTHKIYSNGKSWKVWLGAMAMSEFKKDTEVRSFEYLPKTLTAIEFNKGRTKAVITLPRWLFEEKQWLSSYLVKPKKGGK